MNQMENKCIMPQIDNIKEAKANELFRDCALFAGQFFELPTPLAVGMENYSEERFHHPLCPSFTNCDHGRIMIVFNRDWVYDRIDDHYDDIQFFMLHELRHANQFVQIMQLERGESTQELPQTIKAWMTSFGNYTHNEGDHSSQTQNLSQLIEQDAYAYGFALHDLLHRNDRGYEYYTSLPPEAAGPAWQLAVEYKMKKPELKRYLEGYRQFKPERNDPCPCGSGKKFKKCHLGKGIFER